MERLQPLSKQVIRNDKTVNQEAFYDFTQLFLESLESLNIPPPYQCNRSNKSNVIKYISFLFQIITRYPEEAISVSPHLLQICNLLMNPLNDTQIREDTWRYLINCINCYDVLFIFKSFLSLAFEITLQEFRIDVGEIGKMNEDSLLKQFDQILIKIKKSQDAEKFQLNLQIAAEAIPMKILKNFSLQLRNKIVTQLISEIGLFEKKFEKKIEKKYTIFNSTVDPKLIIYISEIFSIIPSDQSNLQIIYRFVKWTFPYTIINEKNENLTKRANMLYFINHSKYKESLSLSYFRVAQEESNKEAFQHFYKTIKTNFHNIFVKIIDRSIQILPIILKNMRESSDNYDYMNNMCKFFTHVLRIRGITKTLLEFENEKSIIGYFLSISIYNLPFDMLPFMTIFLLSFFVDRKTINVSEESRFVENLMSIVPPNYISQIIQVISKFASQISVGFSPILFQIKDENLKNQILTNPVIFERENVNNQTLHDIIKKNFFIINQVSTITDSSIIATTSNVTSADIKINKLVRSNSSDGFFTILKSIHFFFDINCWNFNSNEAIEFIFNYIQCFSNITNDTLISTISDTFSCLIQLFSNFNMNDFDFSFIKEKFLPFVFKSLIEQKNNTPQKELLFCAFERMIRVLRENFLLTHQISKLWCASILSILPKSNSIVVRAAIQSCLEGLPYSFSLVHAIFISISDWKYKDTQIIAFLTCISIISPEFRNYSLEELEFFASSNSKFDDDIVCMSILLLLHNLFDQSITSKDDENKSKEIDKEVRVLFLNSLKKLRSSPSLVTSILQILPSFFEQLDSSFELIFDTILMDVDALMIKLMEPKKNQMHQNSSSTSFYVAADSSSAVSPPPSKQQHLATSIQKNKSLFVMSASPIASFASPTIFTSDKQNDSDSISKIANTNMKIPSEEFITQNSSNGSISFIVEKSDYTSIQIFKSIAFFCVKLFLAAGKRLQIRKRIVELFQSWTKINKQRNDGEFYEKFNEILFKSVGHCFSPPRSNIYNKNLSSFTQNDNFFVSKQTSSSFVVNNKNNDDFNYSMKISLDYSSSIYSVKPIRNSPIVISKSSSSASINDKSYKAVSENKNSNKYKLNHFSFRNRNRNQEQSNNIKNQIDTKNVDVCLPGLSLFFDALEEANESELEPANGETLQTDFINQFESKFKKRFFIRLIFYTSKSKRKIKTANDNDNQNSSDMNDKSQINIQRSSSVIKNKNGKSQINIQRSNSVIKNKNDKSQINIQNNNNSNEKDQSFHSSNNEKNSFSNISISSDQNLNESSSKESCCINNDSDLFYEKVDEEFSPLFIKFLNSLGKRDKQGNVIASTSLYDAIFEMHPSENHIVAVVWVEESVCTESIIKNLSNEKNHLVIIILSCSKSGIVHTKVVYSSLLISDNENDVFYFDTFHNYSYPRCESICGFNFVGFGPLVGSLFLPCTLIPKLVTETAVNAIIFRKTQMKNMDQTKLKKKKKRKLFPHRH